MIGPKRRQAPDFWWQEPALAAGVLAPASFVYGRVAARRLDHGKRVGLAVPVLCVGNPTVGGGGKTPAAIALARAAIAEGLTPGIVSRGYKRAGKAAVIVDPQMHGSTDVGDEPLLLAAAAPTAVSANRAVAARLLIETRGADFIIMDDGFQSARLETDLALLLVDGSRGLGNWKVLPAGPLRAPIETQFRHADALVVVGDGEPGTAVVSEAARRNRPCWHARLVPSEPARFAGMKVLAFAGIANPSKFVRSLIDCGAEVVETRAFPDHHAYSKADIAALSERAWQTGLQLVTTAKDAARLKTGTEALQLFSAECEVLGVDFVFDQPDLSTRLIHLTQEAFRRRRYG